jgi:hypothetical protein
MSKYRVRDGEQRKDLDIASVSEVDRSTRHFIAIAVVCTGLGVLVLMAVHAIFTHNSAELARVMDAAILLTGLVLGYYFRSPDG